MKQNQVIAELKTQLLLKDERIKQLESREEKLLDRLMARDLTDLNAQQETNEENEENTEDSFEDLDPNTPPDKWEIKE